MDGLLTPAPEILKLAGHPIRWSLLTHLARSDYRVQELVTFLQLPQNLVSYHLRQLRTGNLVTERKSSADERSVYYSLDLERFRSLYLQAGKQLHPALTEVEAGSSDEEQAALLRSVPLSVLFLCTHNSARSQMAEFLLRQLSHGTIEAFSAGSHPAEHIHPLAARVMEESGIDMSQAVPKHFDVLGKRQVDAIVTVCDHVREVCPTFPNDPERIHWSFSDPAEAEGSEEEQYQVFEHTRLALATRIRLLLSFLIPRTSSLKEA